MKEHQENVHWDIELEYSASFTCQETIQRTSDDS